MFLLLVTLVHFSAWDGNPTVVFQQHTENLTQESCTAAATEWRKQYANGGYDRVKITAVCVKQEEKK